jgi:poly-beta-1,6-N-acetyl-D-glucosamine synthase
VSQRKLAGAFMPHKTNYLIITPVRDEEAYIEATLRSVACQSVLPQVWIIVDDGSTDKTADIVERYADEFSWIHIVRKANRGARKSGGGVIEAFYEGYKAVQRNDWEFIVKLDGDLTFSSDYFEKCFDHFEHEPNLGIGGGDIYNDFKGVLKVEANPRFHVRGATKIYRRACWEAIGGLIQAPGWDTIDEVKANMLGWKSYSFSELHVMHHRLTGTAEGLLRDRMKHGLGCYVSGYHPLFLAASCISRLAKRPYVTGSAAMCYGFLKGYWTRSPRVNDLQLIKYLRGQQLRRLWGLETIWR